MTTLATPPAPPATAGLSPPGLATVASILAGPGPAVAPVLTLDDMIAALRDPVLPIEVTYAYDDGRDRASISVRPLGFSLPFEIGRVVMRHGRDYDLEDIDASFTSDLERTGLLPEDRHRCERAKVLPVEILLESQRERIQALVEQGFQGWLDNRDRIRELFGSLPRGARIPPADVVKRFSVAQRLHAVAMRYLALLGSAALPELSDPEWALLDAAVPDPVLDADGARRIDVALAGACAAAGTPTGLRPPVSRSGPGPCWARALGRCRTTAGLRGSRGCGRRSADGRAREGARPRAGTAARPRRRGP